MIPALLLLASLPAAAQTIAVPRGVLMPARPVVEGEFPENAFLDREDKIAAIWDFVKTLGGPDMGLEPPVIHFARFDPAAQGPAWTAWQAAWSAGSEQIWTDWLCNAAGQKKFPETGALCGDQPKVRAWMASHPELRREFPFPAQFRAFHYDGTNRIQIDPYTTYMAYYQNGPDGLKRDYVGYGWHVTGHEMLHYVLEKRGVDPLTHHCVYVTPQADGKSYMEKLDDFLIAKGWGSPALSYRYGAPAEASMNPCGRKP